MRCPKCNYIFSEEIKVCPKCGADMGAVLEKLGYFPVSSSKPFFTIDDFKEELSMNIIQTEEKSEETREIEFPYNSEEEE